MHVACWVHRPARRHPLPGLRCLQMFELQVVKLYQLTLVPASKVLSYSIEQTWQGVMTMGEAAACSMMFRAFGGET
jgi:hypothetical protein